MLSCRNAVISNAGAANTLPSASSSGQPRKLQDVMEKLDRIPPSLGHISLYVGLKATQAKSSGSLPRNLWISSGSDP